MTPTELFESNRELAARLAGRYRAMYGGIDYDDLVQAGLLGLWQAAQRWRPDRGTKFTTFAQHWVRGAITDELRRELGRGGSKPRTISLNLPISRDDEEGERIDLLGEDDLGYDLVDDVDEAQDVIPLVEKLPERLRMVLWLHFVEDLSQRRVGEVLGVSEARVCQLIIRARQLALAQAA